MANNDKSRRKPGAAPAKPVLAADASAAVREQLLTEIAGLASTEQIDSWALRGLPTKNTLTAADAGLIEQAFRKKVIELTGLEKPPSDDPISEASRLRPDELNSPSSIGGSAPESTAELQVKAYAVTAKPRRRRDRPHREFVSAQACVICGRQPSDAHHLRFAQPTGLGHKVSDEFTVPLCRSHHRELHRTGNEVRWWAQFGIDPMGIAYKLWSQTHPVPTSANSTGADVEASAPAAEAMGKSVDAREATTADANYKTNPIQPLGRP